MNTFKNYIVLLGLIVIVAWIPDISCKKWNITHNWKNARNGNNMENLKNMRNGNNSRNGLQTKYTRFGNPCAAFLSPCECNNSSCCGILNNVLNINCYHLPIGVNSVNPEININDFIPIPPNPCLNMACGAGLTCHMVSTVSTDGTIALQNTECCHAEKYSQVNCGANINCQQYNKDGTYTACCNGGCLG